jgi:hypothetical protein
MARSLRLRETPGDAGTITAGGGAETLPGTPPVINGGGLGNAGGADEAASGGGPGGCPGRR